MVKAGEEFHRQMEILRKKYRASLDGRFRKIEEAFADLTRGAKQQEALDIIHVEAHNLKGTSGSFGMAELGEKAWRMDCFVRKLQEFQQPISISERARLNEMIADLRATARLESEPQSPIATADVPLEDLPVQTSGSNLVLVLAGEDTRKSLTTQLSFFGYETRCFESCELFLEEQSRTASAAVIVDLDLFRQTGGVLRGIAPVIFFSEHGDFENRLEACNAGGRHFLEKPLDAYKLVDLLEQKDRSRMSRPYRILIVDDELVQAEQQGFILEQAGMTTRIETRPSRILEAMESFRPELVLLDLYMPECNGNMVAAVLRQCPEYATVPIIFLSSEQATHKQAAALMGGGEDFLTKPAEKNQLVDLVRRRVRRARQLAMAGAEKHALLAELDSHRFALDQHALIRYTDDEGRITYANDGYLRASGYSLLELFGRNPREEDPGSIYPPDLWRDLEAGLVWRGEIRNMRKDGSPWILQCTVVPVFGTEERPAYHIWLANDVTGLRARESNAKKTLEKFEEEVRRRRDSLACLTSEIRSALQSFVASSDRLEIGDLPPETKGSVHELHQASYQLSGLIYKTLDFSRLEANPSLQNQIFDIRECMASVAEQTAAKADEAGLDFHARVSSEVPELVFGDPFRLRQILVNLAEYAVAFTGDGFVSISVSGLERVDGRMRLGFVVHDSGPGIDRSRQEQLFDLTTDTNSQEQGGSNGFNLAITARLVKAMGSQLHIESTPGEGSRFYFDCLMPWEKGKSRESLAGMKVVLCGGTSLLRAMVQDYLVFWGCDPETMPARVLAGRGFLPEADIILVFYEAVRFGESGKLINKLIRSRPERTLVLCRLADHLERARKHFADVPELRLVSPYGSNDLHRLISAVRRQNALAGKPANLAGGESAKRILVVDDNSIGRKIVLRSLNKIGYAGDVVVNGKEAVEAFRNKEYDLILMDCNMPEMDGYQATRAIREIESERGKNSKQSTRIPIVAMTADESSRNRQACAEAGMTGFLVKPFQADAFEKMMANVSNKPDLVTLIHKKTQPVCLEQFNKVAGGETERRREVFDLFDKATSRELAALGSALRDGDSGLLLHLCKILGDATRELGAKGLEALIASMERMVGEGRIDVAQGLFASLESEARRVRAFLEDHIGDNVGAGSKAGDPLQ